MFTLLSTLISNPLSINRVLYDFVHYNSQNIKYTIYIRLLVNDFTMPKR